MKPRASSWPAVPQEPAPLSQRRGRRVAFSNRAPCSVWVSRFVSLKAGAGTTAGEPGPYPPGLGSLVGSVATRPRRPHSPARVTAGPSRRLHWVRLSLFGPAAVWPTRATCWAKTGREHTTFCLTGSCPDRFRPDLTFGVTARAEVQPPSAATACPLAGLPEVVPVAAARSGARVSPIPSPTVQGPRRWRKRPNR